jgi:predicted  nucleic acid-binding Zn-ribbon protein
MNKLILSIVGASALNVLAGCGGVSEVTKERVARSETAVQQAQQTVGNSEAGAVELQRAKEQLDAARKELSRENSKQAERYAAQAQLTAELAVAKSQSSQARKAADELMASIETLRQEAARGTSTAR